MTIRPWAVFAAVELMAAAGCSAPAADDGRGEPGDELLVTTLDSGGVTIMELSHTLNEVARGAVRATELTADLRVGREDQFGAAVDLTALPGGRIAVLDRLERGIVVLDSSGSIVERLGREGDGPGEFRAPWALEAMGEHLIVWQNRAGNTFTVFGPDGGLSATEGRQVPGDWGRPRYREPHINVVGLRGQSGPEDVTRRLEASGDSAFLLYLQLDEFTPDVFQSPRDHPEPPAQLIRYDLLARARDTLAELVGRPTWILEAIPGLTVRYTQPLFSPGPIWATGAGWIATGHGSTPRVVVRRHSGDPAAIARWPARLSKVNEEDRLEAARWVLAHRILNFSFTRRWFEDHSSAEIRDVIEEEADRLLQFADTMGSAAAAYGVGQCLLLAGYEPSDWADGTALTWVALNVQQGTLEGVFRIGTSPGEPPLELERIGAAVRDFDQRSAYTIARDGLGRFIVERFPLPGMDCGG